MKPLSTETQAETAATFSGDFERCMQRLRGALTDLLAAGGADPRQPQEISRSFGLNKNLAWKICKIINSTNSDEVAQHVPGNAGMRILTTAFKRRGVPAAVIAQVSSAIDAFELIVRRHVGDRNNLDLYLGSGQADGIHSDQLELKRRMSFQGNSVIWGVQARVGFTLKAISPTVGKPDRADLTTVGGMLDFRRLRPTASWPLLRQLTLSLDVEVGHEPTEGVDPNHDGTGAPLMLDFCSKPIAETRRVVEGDTTIYEICEGPVGNTAAVDITFGSIDRDHVPVRSDSEESVGEHYCRMDTPVEMMQFDLLVHRSLPFAMPPQLATYSMLEGTVQFPLSRHTRRHLPGKREVQYLGNSLHGFATPHIRRYGSLIAQTCEQIGYPLEEFDGYRVTLAYPPIPAIMVMHHSLGSAK